MVSRCVACWIMALLASLLMISLSCTSTPSAMALSVGVIRCLKGDSNRVLRGFGPLRTIVLNGVKMARAIVKEFATSRVRCTAAMSPSVRIAIVVKN